ncbi:hypothetical protein LXA43DRAFT_1064188 [Ganoderma leucocontextum]|nr:hypothetical protein LXA43DRAFT_1064188 [Ganoderma leucocontextum]
MVFHSIFLVLLFPVFSWAASNWNEPCHSGMCQWDISTDTGSAALRIVGSQSSISDLTEVAGWTVLDCDVDSSGQINIRLACHDPSLCDHLYLNGAENTVVRLPDQCGSDSFAFVDREWIHEDQSIPDSTRSALVRRDGTVPTVKGMSLTGKLEHPEVSQHGEVSFFLQASSISGLGDRLLASPHADDHRVSRKRWVSDLTLELREVHANFATGEWDVDHSEGPDKFVGDTNGTKELFSYSLPCPIFASEHTSVSGAADLRVAGRMNGTMSYGVVAAGVFGVHDPNITEFSLFVDLDADIRGMLDIGVNLTGTVTTPDLTLFEIGIPSLYYPKILSIGPTFSVIARADATLEADMDFQAGIAYKISNAHLVFPDGDKQSNGTFTPGDSALQLSVSPGITTSATLAVHLVPTISFGINLEVVDTEATISIGLDAQAALSLSLSSASETAGSNTVQPQPELGGCVNVTTGLSVSAGADAGLFELFDAGDAYQLWGDDWQLWGNCWDIPRKRDVSGNATGDWYADRGMGHRVPLWMFEENLMKDHRKSLSLSTNSTSISASVSGSVDQAHGQKGASESNDTSKDKDGSNDSGDGDGSTFSLACPKLKPGAVQRLIQPETVKGSR